jgi:hypothetical protein
VQLEAPAEAAVELAGADGHPRRRAALDLHLHAGGPVEAPAAQRAQRRGARGQAAGEDQRQLEVVLQGEQVREEGRRRRRLEGQRGRVVRQPDAEGGILGAGGSGEAGHELTAGDHVVAVGAGSAAVGTAVGGRREQRGGVRQERARRGRRGRAAAAAADGGGGGVGEAGLAAGAAEAEALLAGRRDLAGLLEHPRDHPLVLIQHSTGEIKHQQQCKKLRCSSMTRKRMLLFQEPFFY